MRANHNNEEKLMERFGKENPFRVPEGYFDRFPDKVMSQINRKKKRQDSWRWVVAAVMAGCVACAGFMLFKKDLGLTEQKPYMANIANVEQMDEILDCNIVSNLEIESFLTEVEQ